MTIEQIIPRLDKKLFENSGFSSDEVMLTCLAVIFKLNVTLNSDHLIWLSQNGYLKRTKDGLVITLDKTEPNTQITISDEDLKTYRNLFSGIRIGSIGNKQIVKNNLLQFLNENDYSMQEIINATRSFMQTADIQFVPNADNFVYNIKNGKQVSMLEIALESELKNEKWI